MERTKQIKIEFSVIKMLDIVSFKIHENHKKP